MKKLLWIFASALLLVNLFLSTGCSDDPDPVVELDPEISVTANTSTTVVGTGKTVEFEVVGVKTTNDLQSLTILEDGTQVDDDRITISGISLASNPQLITGSDVSGFTWDVTIEAHDSGEKSYTFRLTDTKSNTAEESVEVIAETEIETTISGVLWNQAGPPGKGALDLDAGKSTGVNSNGEVPKEDAEIRDAGIDSTNAAMPLFWRKQITYVNGTTLRYVGSTTPESTFDDINSKEAIERIYEAATPISTNAITQNTAQYKWGNYKVSDVVEEGDIFAVSKPGGRTYLFRIDNIVENLSTTPPAGNEDYYELTIKY